MRPNDGVGGDGGIGATGEEAGGRSTATMEEFDPSRPAKGKSVKGKAAKERAPKKSKGKSALASDSASAADHVGTDSTAEDRLGTDSTAEDRLGTGSVAADPMASEPVVADLELTDLDLLATVPAVSDDAEGSDDPESDGVGTLTPKPPSTRRQWARSNIALLCAGAVVVALSVALALSLSALGNQDALGSSRTSALAAARTDAVQLASYNYGDLGRDFGVVVADSTPSFRRRFTESSDALKSTLTEYKATAEASVVSAGLVSASTSRAVVLVLLDQKIANSKQATPTTDRSQIEITLVSSGGRWLIDQVTLL
jgi:Mce-associated membrane protein